MLREMQSDKPAPRRVNPWVVAAAVLLVLGVVVALVVVLRPKSGAKSVPSNPTPTTLSKGTQATSAQMTAHSLQGLNMVGFTSGKRINFVASTLGKAGPGVVGGAIMFGSLGVVSFAWTPEAPPKGAAGPSSVAPGAGKSFIPGTLSMTTGSGLMRTTMYLAPNAAAGQVGWTEDKTYVGLYPVGSSGNTFYLAFLSQGTRAAVYGVPQNGGKPFILSDAPGNGFYVAFTAA